MYSLSAKDQNVCACENDVKVFSNGSCAWYREYQLSTTHCPMDVTWFPFDEQYCELQFESKTHESRELNATLEPTGHKPVDYLYETNGEWTLVGKIYKQTRNSTLS